jgi:hypothetical protein
MKFFLWILMFFSCSVISQSVTVADEINIRSYYAYDMLGQVDDNILLFLDKGLDQFINIYDKDLKFKRKKELIFERRKVRIHYLTPKDSSFNIVYSYKERDTIYYKIREYDKNVVLIDSLTLEKNTSPDAPRSFRYSMSDDKSKTVLFAQQHGKIVNLKVIDNINNLEMWSADVELKKIDAKDDFRKLLVTNEGVVLYLFEQNNSRFSRDDHILILLGLFKGGVVLQSKINLNDRVSCDLGLAYNNKTGNVVIAGLSSEKKVTEASEYFYVNKHIANFQLEEFPEVRNIGVDFIREVYGRKKVKEKELKDFLVYDIISRQDGGFIMISEMDREYQRRTAFNSVTRTNRSFNSPVRGWTDHYNEDVVVFAVHPTGEEHWRKVLYKKQFSQDDGGMFSSFYLFKTPSRLKLIYNDEIKNNNTVSEYVLNPLGQYERNSLLSTEYQNLRLRFRDAIQLNNQQLLIPSEKNYNLRLVKIDYSTL